MQVFDSKYVLKVYFKPSRKNNKKIFLPLPSELVWLKILHLNQKNSKSRQPFWIYVPANPAHLQ